VKTRNTPTTRALCKGDHTANYKDCQIYKQIHKLQISSKRQGTHLINTQHINKFNKTNCNITKQPTPTVYFPSLSSRSYAQATTNQNLHPSPATKSNDLFPLTNFIYEFKALINLLSSLLTTVFQPATNPK